jgi:hypothetical protein
MVPLTTCVYSLINCVCLSNNFEWSDMFSEIRRRMRYLPPPYSFYGEVTRPCSMDIPWYLYRYSGACATCRRSLLAKVHLKKKFGGRKTPRFSIGNQISYRSPSSFFRLRCFLGVNFSEYWLSGAWMGRGSYFCLNLIYKYRNVQLQKKHTSEHPLPDLRPDFESWANFGLQQTFKIFKNIQKHISSSGVGQGHSTAVKRLQLCTKILI